MKKTIKLSAASIFVMLIFSGSIAMGADAVLDNAKKTYDSGNYASAASLFKQHYDSLPDQKSDAAGQKSKASDLLNIGRCKRSLGQYNESRMALSSLIANHNVDSDISAEAQYLIGCSYKDENDLKNAAQALDKVVKDYPDNGAWCSTSMLLEGKCQLLNKQYGGAAKTFKTTISNYSSKKGICLDAKVDLVQTLMRAGRIGGKTGMWAALDKVSADYQSDNEICAYADFLKSRYGKNNDVPDFNEAATMFKAQTLDSGPVNISNMSSVDAERLAGQNYERSNYPRALQLYKDYYQQKLDCKEHPECRAANVRVMFVIANCYIKLHDFANARTWLLQIISDYPGDASACIEAQSLIAESYGMEGMLPEAMATYDTVLTRCSFEPARYADALLAKGKLQRKFRKYTDSIKTFQSLQEKYPDQDVVKNNVGYCIAEALAANKQFDEALTAIDQLINDGLHTREHIAALLYWKATVQSNAHRPTDCQKTIQDLLSNYSDQKAICRDANLLLASVLVEIRNKDAALSVLSKLREDQNYSHEDQACIMLWTGFANLASDTAKAEELMGVVISDYGDTPICQQAYMHRAVLRIARGAYAEAMSDIQMIQVPCWKSFAEGEYYLAQKEYAKAIASYGQVYPNYKAGEMPADVPARALINLQQCYEITGDSAKADETSGQLAKLRAENIISRQN